MKDRRGGAGFPFSIGCMSQSAVAVADPLDKKPPPPAPQQADLPSSSTATTAATTQERGAGEESSEDKAKAAAASGIVSAGVQRLLKSIVSGSGPMKDHRSGAGFPFSIGCMSQSAVAVADPLDKKPPAPQPQQADTPSSSSTTTTAATTQERGAGQESSEDKAKAAAASGIVSAGVQRLLKGIKTFFAAYDGEEEDEEEREIVIGYPTDVQHVGHIGWDGINKVSGMGVGMAGAFSLPSSLSLRQLEIAMDPGAAAATCIN